MYTTVNTENNNTNCKTSSRKRIHVHTRAWIMYGLWRMLNEVFLISNFHRVLNTVCFLLGNSPASEFYMPTFWHIKYRRWGITQKKAYNILHTYLPTHEDGTECSKTSTYKNQKPGNTQKRTYNIQNIAKVWNLEYFTSIGRKLQDTFNYLNHSSYLPAYEDGTVFQNVGILKFRHQGITH